MQKVRELARGCTHDVVSASDPRPPQTKLPLSSPGHPSRFWILAVYHVMSEITLFQGFLENRFRLPALAERRRALPRGPFRVRRAAASASAAAAACLSPLCLPYPLCRVLQGGVATVQKCYSCSLWTGSPFFARSPHRPLPRHLASAPRPLLLGASSSPSSHHADPRPPRSHFSGLFMFLIISGELFSVISSLQERTRILF